MKEVYIPMHNKVLKYIGLEFIFLMITILLFLIEIHTQVLPFNVDAVFHWRRIVELANDLRNFQLPSFNQHAGMPLGVATLTFYPWLNILPISILLLMHITPVASIITVIFTELFIGFNISFLACRSYSHNGYISAIFALSYCASTIVLYYLYYVIDLGAFSSFLFAPLVFFGWLSWIHNDHWKMMVIGFALMLCCHILNTSILFGLLLLLTGAFYKKLNKTKLQEGLKALIILILITSIIWMPICILMISNQTTMTNNFKLFNFIKYGGLIPEGIDFVVPSHLCDWTYCDLIMVILGIFEWKHFNSTIKILYGYSIFILIMTLNIPHFSPILLFKYTPLTIIQDVYRLSIMSHLILSYLIAYTIIKVLFKQWKKYNVWILIIFMSLLTLLAIGVGTLENDTFVGTRAKTLKQIKKSGKKTYFFKLNNTDLESNSALHQQGLTGSTYDYVPKTVKGYKVPIHDHIKLISHRHNIQIHSDKALHDVNIPYILYSQQNYKIYYNQGQISNRYHFLHLSNIPKGNSYLRINASIMWYRWLSILLTIGGLFLLCHSKVRNRGGNGSSHVKLNR